MRGGLFYRKGCFKCRHLTFTPRVLRNLGLEYEQLRAQVPDTGAPDDVYEEVRSQFSEKQLADLSIVIAMINAWNRLAIGTRSTHPADVAKAA